LIFDKLIAASQDMEAILAEYSYACHTHDFPWPAKSYQSPEIFRQADIDIIDAREDRKLWMMHLCIYPHVNDPAPIFGFDIIAGPNKVTGAFHDFSPIDPYSHILSEFATNVQSFIPSKARELPDWAKNIFSGNMVSAGNIRDGKELDDLLELVINNLKYFIKNIGMTTDNDYTEQHNWYAINQKKNPHTARVMENMGVDPTLVQRYINECLFPEI
jgi:hypothetical protein